MLFMTPTAILLLVFAALLNARSANAQPVSCSKELVWTDATYARRITTKEGRLAKAEVEAFANGSKAYLEVDGVRSEVIDVKTRKDSIQLTFGHGRPRPVEFSEIAMAVEPPMNDGTWARMGTPCAVPDGGSIFFDQNDLPGFNEQQMPRFRGTLVRAGLRISYSMAVEGGETWQGELNFAAKVKDVDLNADVQGWNVFRSGSYRETLPMGRPFPVSAVIEKLH